MARIQVEYVLTVRDREGRILKRVHGKSRSFVIAFLQQVECCMRAATVTIVDITGTGRSSVYGQTNLLRADGALGDVNKGIVVGTGTTAPTNSDYALGSRIGHGTGAGQLQYQVQSWNPAGVVGANVDFVGTRSYINGSGATVTVREIGIYTSIGSATLYYACIIRDVLPTPVNVANGETLTAQYTLRSTV